MVATQGSDELSILDAQINEDTLRRCLKFSSVAIGQFWSIIPMSDNCCSDLLEAFRTHMPTTLIAIVGFAISNIHANISPQGQDDLRRKVLEILGSAAVGLRSPSLDLVLAALVAAFWNRPSVNDTNGNSFQMVHLAYNMSIDLGFGGPEFQSSPATWFFRFQGTVPLAMRQTWLVSCVASTMMAISLRRKPAFDWGRSHYEAVQIWEQEGSTDALFLEILYIAVLHAQIAKDLEFSDMQVLHDIDSEKVSVAQVRTQKRLNELTSRPLGQDPQLQFWRALAIIYVNEPVLHTSTNKGLFSAPYIAAKIGATDFARPIQVTRAAERALLTIVEASHLVIELVRQMEPSLVLAMPSLCFAPGISYAFSILVKVFVAVSAPGNTYGRVLSRQALRLEDAMVSLIAVKEALLQIDPFMANWNTRLVGSVEWLGNWLADYEAILTRYEQNLETGNADMAIEDLSPFGAF
jgi:hypothetical protein